MTPRRPTETCIARHRRGWLSRLICSSVPLASTTSSATSCSSLLRLPYDSDEPCEPVHTAPPTVWNVNQGKLPSVYPRPYDAR
jgi:hypothetical protein